MKDITEAALSYLLAAHPNAVVEDKDGTRIVRVPMYDIETDRAWIEERRIVKGPAETPMGILPVFNIRKGATFNPGGEPRTGPLGQLYRIIGYSPDPDGDKKD